MLMYWLLLAYPAVMALAYPARTEQTRQSAGQVLALAGFVLFYTLMAGMRWDVGGDWGNYEEIYDDIALSSLSYAMGVTDPLYGLVNWVSAQFDLDIYFVNGVCAFLLVLGVAQVVGRFRDPWLAVLMAVPYLLIVVGLGYIRQGAAIGLLLMAIAAFDRGKLIRTGVFLLMAIGFHATAIMVIPLFGYSLGTRYRLFAVVVGLATIYAYFAIVVPALDRFNAGYIDQELESTGALTRLLMSFIPSLLLLLRWRHIGGSSRLRPVWISVAIANVLLLLLLFVSPSSTAVDRAGLYFSIAQLLVFGEFRNLLPTPERMTAFVRVLLIGVASAVQVVWLVYATNAEFWVPYKTLFEAI